MNARIEATVFGVLLACLAGGALAQGPILAEGSEGGKRPKIVKTPAASPLSEAERAARLAEGRRKFFGQSQGFDHDTPLPDVAVAPSRADLWPGHFGPKLRR